MSFIETIKRLFVSPTSNVLLEAHDHFDAASKACDTAFESIEIYTKRANNRSDIQAAKDALNKAPSGDKTATANYNVTVAACKHPEDFTPYTSTDLDAHTAAINGLESAFERLKDAAGAINRADSLYPTARKLVIITASLCECHVEAYERGAKCASLTALRSQMQSLEEEWKMTLLEARASNSKPPTDAEQPLKDAALKKQTAQQNNSAAVLLEQKAKQAEKRSQELLATLKAAQSDN
jgi:hypothetical protein